jgi:hypothetical protein
MFPSWLVQELQNNQSRREVLGATLGLKTFKNDLEWRRVGLVSDNSGQVSVFNQMRNRRLAPWVAEALWFCMDNGIELHRACWIPSREMVRRGVDGLSRWVDVNDWTLREKFWAKVLQFAGMLEVDRFASSNNAKLPRWNSRFHEPGSEAVDALAQDWTATISYVCSPLALLGQVVGLLSYQRARAVVVVPAWTGHVWWPMLVRLAPNPKLWLYLGKGAEVFEVGPSGSAAPVRRNWDFWVVKVNWA